MTKFTIELAGDYVVTSRGVECVVALDGLTAEMVTNLALHGLTQKVSDAASQAAKDLVKGDPVIAVNTSALMDKAAKAIMEGQWTLRGTGTGGASEEVTVQRSIMRQQVKIKLGSKSPKWAAFTGLDMADQIAKLDELFAVNADKLAKAVSDELARRKAARDAKGALGKELSIDL